MTKLQWPNFKQTIKWTLKNINEDKPVINFNSAFLCELEKYDDKADLFERDSDHVTFAFKPKLYEDYYHDVEYFLTFADLSFNEIHAGEGEIVFEARDEAGELIYKDFVFVSSKPVKFNVDANLHSENQLSVKFKFEGAIEKGAALRL